MDHARGHPRPRPDAITRRILIPLAVLGVLGGSLLAFSIRAHTPPTDATGLDALMSRVTSAVQQAVGESTAPVHTRVLIYSAPAADSTNPSAWSAELPATLPDRVVLLIHGLDEPGAIWDDLAPALAQAGHTVLAFEYPNDQSIATSALGLANAMRGLKARGVASCGLACHSMGGLVARDALTRPDLYAGRALGRDDLPDVPSLVLLGTPNAGSPWAKLRAVSELREHAIRLSDSGVGSVKDLVASLRDGQGQAGTDLLPGSAFLTELNARPLPEGVAITLVIGRLAESPAEDLAWIADDSLLARVVGEEEAGAITRSIRQLNNDLGDGVVPVSSAELPGVADRVYVEASHRGMIESMAFEQTLRRWTGIAPGPPPGIAIAVDRLSK